MQVILALLSCLKKMDGGYNILKGTSTKKYKHNKQVVINSTSHFKSVEDYVFKTYVGA